MIKILENGKLINSLTISKHFGALASWSIDLYSNFSFKITTHIRILLLEIRKCDFNPAQTLFPWVSTKHFGALRPSPTDFLANLILSLWIATYDDVTEFIENENYFKGSDEVFT